MKETGAAGMINYTQIGQCPFHTVAHTFHTVERGEKLAGIPMERNGTNTVLEISYLTVFNYISYFSATSGLL